MTRSSSSAPTSDAGARAGERPRVLLRLAARRGLEQSHRVGLSAQRSSGGRCPRPDDRPSAPTRRSATWPQARQPDADSTAGLRPRPDVDDDAICVASLAQPRPDEARRATGYQLTSACTSTAAATDQRCAGAGATAQHHGWRGAGDGTGRVRKPRQWPGRRRNRSFEAYCARCGWHRLLDAATYWCGTCLDTWTREYQAREGEPA